MDVRDIEKILSDLNLRECILYSHKRNIQDLMIALVNAKQSSYFSWGGERLYQKSWTKFLCTAISVLNKITVTTVMLSISLTQMSIIKQLNSPIPTYYKCQFLNLK